MIEPASRVQEKFHVLHPVNTGNPAEAGAYGMYQFYRWQALGGESSRNTMSRELSGVYTRIRALLRDMDARKENYDRASFTRGSTGTCCSGAWPTGALSTSGNSTCCACGTAMDGFPARLATSRPTLCPR